MTVTDRIAWYYRIRFRILMPSITLFVLFAAVAIFGSTRQLTRMADRDARAELRHAEGLFTRLMGEVERRVSLHARFVADMLLLTAEVPEADTGRSILINILEYSRQEQLTTSIFTADQAAAEPFGALVRKGLLGIRASSLAGSAEGELSRVRIAAGSPLMREGEIREVVISWLELDRRVLEEFSRKSGQRMSLVYEGQIVASTVPSMACLDRIREILTEEVQEEILGGGVTRVENTLCADEAWRMSFVPLEVGFRKTAIGVVSLSLEDLVQARARAVRNTGLAAIALLVLAILGYSTIVRRITRPIRSLSEAARDLDDDGIGHEVRIASRSEVGELADNYNAMIRRLRKSKAELEELHRQEMERADRLATLGELAGGIAHEVRNPLAGISGAMQCFESSIPSQGDKREMYEEVLRQIDRMENLTRDLLDYSRHRAPELSPSDLNALLDRACLLTTIGVKDGDIRIEKAYDPKLPAVLVDPEKMQQVFLNILLNCMQAMPDGGAIRVGTSAVAEGPDESVQVTIADEGPGMDSETLANALRPFFTTKHTGTGLGLSIARKIVESHGGSLRIHSTRGEGSTFTLRLPLQVNAEADS
ncbi:MAG: HAMP domain-containing protein [Acidobacteria bacterium]|uniref:histidine kinase n=1 Tax=Candidatus Polarisedimenticola svalbardensis TaxID=2886004 RepID=A0A8J6XX04_9BACT|nr:HAMP domain-containing protein [Candidatus Polarisedimenticola svalbardensis]